MLIADLKDHLANVQERSLETTLAEIEVDDEARNITLASGEVFQFDAQAERSLSKYLGVSPAYLAKCPPELKAHNLNFWLQRRGHAAAVIEASNEHWVTIHKPGLLVLPLARVADVVTETLDPNFEVVSLIRNDTLFQLDVATDHQVEVAPDDRIEDRRSVGDITRGGIRIVSNPSEQMAPVVQTYLHRLVCTNGLVSSEAEGTIRLKGHTIDDIFIEMEAACHRVLGDLDSKLAEYAALATQFPPGSPVRFAYQIGRERGLSKKVMDRIMERVNILPDDATIYDVLQVFTELANSGSVNYATMIKLQGIGGELAFETEAITHRCGQCERILPDA